MERMTILRPMSPEEVKRIEKANRVRENLQKALHDAAREKGIDIKRPLTERDKGLVLPSADD